MEVMIVDDEPGARRSVRECCEREPDLKVVGEYGDPSAALEAIRQQAPQLLFLDIQMDSMSGLALARVRRRHQAHGPLDRRSALEALLEQLERGARVRAEAQPRVLAEAGSRMHMLDVSQVEVVEADRNYVRLTIGRETFHARSTLQQAEKSFQAQPMLRISRSCLVNMSHVREVSRTPRGDFILVVTGGTTVTSSEGFREPVRQYLERLKLAPA